MAKNPSPSLLDSGQIVKLAFDEANDRIRVDAEVSISSGEQEVVIDHGDDSIRIGDGTNLVTASVVGAKTGIDANIIGGVVSGNFSSSGLNTGLKTQTMTITDVPTKVPATPLVNRNGVSIRVWGTETVYFGTATVTVADGYPKNTLEEISLDIKDSSAVELYAVCEPGKSSEVRILELA